LHWRECNTCASATWRQIYNVLGIGRNQYRRGGMSLQFVFLIFVFLLLSIYLWIITSYSYGIYSSSSSSTLTTSPSTSTAPMVSTTVKPCDKEENLESSNNDNNLEIKMPKIKTEINGNELLEDNAASSVPEIVDIPFNAMNPYRTGLDNDANRAQNSDKDPYFTPTKDWDMFFINGSLIPLPVVSIRGELASGTGFLRELFNRNCPTVIYKSDNKEKEFDADSLYGMLHCFLTFLSFPQHLS
jgi:hypothetical protein